MQQEVSAPVESASSRYQLLGVVAPARAGSNEGVALISVGGAPARSVRIGQVIDGELQLIEVNRRDVGLGRDGAVSVRLTLPAAGAGGASPVAMAPNGGMGFPGGAGDMQPPTSLPTDQAMEDMAAPAMQGGSPLTIGQPLPRGPGAQPPTR